MNTTSRARAFAVAALGVLLAAPPAGAQNQTQNATVTGKVTSQFGQPIEGANVYITDLSVSVPSDAQGNYRITIPAARVLGQAVNLRIRAFGYRPEAVAIRITAGSQTHNFTLQQDVNRLDEVVVTGVVGEGMERSKVPFAVGRITAEDLPVPALDPIRALSGKVAGLRIAQTSGRPGSEPEIMLRGPNSINASGRGQGPLIVVDGAIMNVGSMQELGGLDIESVEVVKGAAGASLYGTRAANGVINIKTKRGGSGTDGVRFNVRSEYGVSDLNSLEYGMPIYHQLQLDETGTRFCVLGSANVSSCSRTLRWMDEIQRINSVNADTIRTSQNVQFVTPGATDMLNIFQAQIWPERYYNPIAQMVRRNPITLNAVDASGKMGAVRFFVSGSYQDEQGALLGLEGNQQRRARVNLDYDARSDLLISVGTLYDRGTNDNRGSFFGALLRGASVGTDYLGRDSLGRAFIRSGGANLRSATGNGGGTFLYDAENVVDKRTTDRFLGNLTARYFPKDWVTIEGVAAFDSRNRLDENWVPKGYRTQGISTANNNGNMGLSNLDNRAWNTSLTASLQKQLRSDLNGRLTLRGLYDEDYSIQHNSSGQIFQIKDIYTTSNTTQNKNTTSSSQLIKNVGLFAGASLDYKDKYIVDGTFRYDGSSLFGEGNRWAPFGRASLVWRVSEEDFWKTEVVSDFRLRASRGTAGNTPRFTAQYETYTVGSGGVSLGQAGNSKLRPETVTETELGTDFTLFNRLGVELTYAHAVAEDQILLVNTPASLGFSTQWQNAGTLDNKTIEVSANLPIINRRDVQWSMRGTFDRVRSHITELFTSEYVSDGGTAQGTSSFFRITANSAKDNGLTGTNFRAYPFPQNRIGNVWGRKFFKSCSELPASVQGDCGPGKAYQVDDKGWLVWVGTGNDTKSGITKNLWGTKLPAANSPWNVPLFYGHPIVDRPLKGEPGERIGITQIIGNTMPDFRFGWSNNLQYKKLNLYALVDATMGHDIYNQGEGWGLLDFSSSYFDMGDATVETAKPMGYSWRAGAPESTGTGGFYDVLGPNNYVVEDGSFAKIREMSATYRIGSVAGVGDWTIGVVGRNLLTFTKYSGLDPEVGATGGNNQFGSGLVNQTDAFGFPTLRTFTLSLSTRF
jgi:TonB-linked SusC/RagA family outer membrane protein